MFTRVSARTRFIGTYAMSARLGLAEQLHQCRAIRIAARVDLRVVPVRAGPDLLVHDVAQRCIRPVAGQQAPTERRPCRSHSLERMLIIVVPRAR